jgi:hypothetical protein
VEWSLLIYLLGLYVDLQMQVQLVQLIAVAVVVVGLIVL